MKNTMHFLRPHYKLYVLLFVTTLFMSNTAFANVAESDDAVGEKDLKTEIQEYVTHHLKDSHDFSLFSIKITSGNSCLTISQLLSEELLSTTIISASILDVAAFILCKHSSRK